MRALGILFVQVGKDPEATMYLTQLCSALVPTGAKFGIVTAAHIDDLADSSLVDIIERSFSAAQVPDSLTVPD